MIFAVLNFEIIKTATVLWYQLTLLCSLVFFDILRMIASFAAIIWELCHALRILREWISPSLRESHHSGSTTSAHLRCGLRVWSRVHYHWLVSISELFKAGVLESLSGWHATILVIYQQLYYHVLDIRLHVWNQLGYTCPFLLWEVEFHMWCMPLKRLESL